MPKKPKKNPTDPAILARQVIEAAIGEPLTPHKAKAKKPVSRHKKR